MDFKCLVAKKLKVTLVDVILLMKKQNQTKNGSHNSQHDDTQYNETQHNNKKRDTHHNGTRQCHYAECHK